MLQLDEMPAMDQLWIGDRLGAVLDLMRGNPLVLEPTLQHKRIKAPSPIRNQPIELLLMLSARRGRAEARIGQKLGPPHRVAERLPIAIIAARDRDPAVIAGTGINSVRDHFAIAIPSALSDSTICGVVEQGWSEKRK